MESASLVATAGSPLAMQIHSEVEAEGLGKEFAGWYFERGFKSSYFRSWNRSERRYNWLMSQSLGFHFSFHWRYNQSKFNSQQKQDSRNLLYFVFLHRPANYSVIIYDLLPVAKCKIKLTCVNKMSF